MSAAAITGEQHLEAGSAHKWLIALAVMLGTTLEVLDTSIVNVSLPHMQGSFSASVDEIAWVRDQLPGRQRHHDPDDRMDFVALRTQALLHDLGDRCSSPPRRCAARRTSLDQMVIFRLDPGRGGRGDDPVVAGDPDGDLSARRAAARDGDVGHRA